MSYPIHISKSLGERLIQSVEVSIGGIKYRSPSDNMIWEFIPASSGKSRDSHQPSNKFISCTFVKDDTCPICLSDKTQDVVMLECTHKYHKLCIIKWLKHKSICPICKHKVN